MDNNDILFSKMWKYAVENDNIRLVEMNGSRVNPNIEKDEFQDFDIVFYVSDVEEFKLGFDYRNFFGEVLVVQTSDDQRDGNKIKGEEFTYLIQFKDGTRLDLTVMNIDLLETQGNQDSLSKILLNKDDYNVTSSYNESSYYVRNFEEKDFYYCINEFFWVCPYVGKGLARQQIFYALKHLDILRHELERVLDWWIGIENDFKVSVGKGKSRYKNLLPEDWYEKYEKTYTIADTGAIKSALYVIMSLFNEVAEIIANKFSFNYDIELKNEVEHFMKKIYKI